MIQHTELIAKLLQTNQFHQNADVTTEEVVSALQAMERVPMTEEVRCALDNLRAYCPLSRLHDLALVENYIDGIKPLPTPPESK